MSEQFHGKVVLVTGGGSGIGRATALAFADAGAAVMLGDVNERGCEETISAIRDRGGQAEFVSTDVSQSVQVERMVKTTVDRFGRLDCAVNSAGVAHASCLVTDLTEDEWNSVLDINLKGTWLCLKYEIPVMLERGGAIVNLASIAGITALARVPAYSASKHGVVGLTKAAGVQFAAQGVRINAICPGWIDTPMTAGTAPELMVASIPAGRLGHPDDVAQTALWLCSNAARHFNGSSIVVDGGTIASV